MPLASPATEPKRHWLSLPLGCPAGGGVAVLVARLPFTLALFLPPSPRPPSQREGGDFKVILCKGLRPLHPPGLNPCGTYRTCQAGARSGALPLGAEPVRHLQNLPSGCPEWGFAPCGAGMGGVPVPGGGRGGFGRPPAFYLSFVFSPIPPPPFPAGRGRLKVFLCKGLRPLHPRG